jgi:hypothetical protein
LYTAASIALIMDATDSIAGYASAVAGCVLLVRFTKKSG